MASGALLSAVLVFLSFPPVDLGLLAWIALVPLLYALGCARQPREGGLVGLIYGVVFFGLFFYYIASYGILPLVLLALFQGLFFGVFGWLAVYLRPVRSLLLRAAGAAGAWVLIEYLRGHAGPLSLTFGDLAYTQYQVLSVLQIASVLGAGAVTLVVVFANGILAGMLLQPQLYPYDPKAGRPPSLTRPVLGGYAMVVAVMVGGASVIQLGSFAGARVKAIAAGKPLQVAVAQGSVPVHHPTTEEDADRCRLAYTYMTSDFPRSVGADLVVWPETAIPVELNANMSVPKGDTTYLEEVQKSAREAGGYLLMGALERGAGGQLYNSAYLFTPEGELEGTYRKVDLVLFGEYVPKLGLLNALVKRYPVRPFDIVPGGERRLLTVDEVPFGTLICWEAVFAAPCRELCRKGAQFLTFITSDSWAGLSGELEQHGATAPMRAVESRRFVVRAATMGPSAIINPYGRELAGLPAGEGRIFDAKIYPLAGLSVYHRIGDLPLLVICVLLWVVAMSMRRPQSALLPPE